MKSKILVVLAMGLLAGSATVHAGYLIDTGTPAIDTGISGGPVRAGQFTVTETVTIQSVEHWTTMLATSDVTMSIRGNSTCVFNDSPIPCPKGNFSEPDDVLFSGTFNATQGGPGWIGLTGLDWVLTPGTYWLIRAPGSTQQAIFASAFSPCADGSSACGFFDGVDHEANWNGTQWGPNGARVGWRIGVASVPEPGTLALLGLGLAGLALGRKRKAA